jgi:CheY-like chemotaxis protein
VALLAEFFCNVETVKNMSKVSILVVDDEAEIRGISQLLLEEAGCNVVCAEGGQQALACMQAQSFDLLITDMLMPEMDGVEFINAVRRVKPEQRIMAMSGGGQAPKESYLQIAAMYGVNGLLPKPFNRVQLLKGISDSGLELPGSAA